MSRDNLSTDKPQTFAEMHRVLRPGGRIGVSDIVAEKDVSPEKRIELGTSVGCIAGALSFEEFEAGLVAAGFCDVSIVPTSQYLPGLHAAIMTATKPA